jgi:hypothetical protein
MVTATLVMLFVMLIVLAGEAVRGQCRRMLTTDAARSTDAVAGPVRSKVAA